MSQGSAARDEPERAGRAGAGEAGVDDARGALLERLRAEGVANRDVVLSSGRRSTLYVDCTRVLLHPEGMALAGRALVADWLESGPPVDAVGGPALGADPMTCAFVLEARSRGRPVGGFLLRSEPKGHGTGAWLEAPAGLPAAARLLLLEDVVTSGGSALRSVHRLREAGYEVTTCLALVDREEGGRDTLAEGGVELRALFGRAEVAPREGGG